jgi:hypothetical protein
MPLDLGTHLLDHLFQVKAGKFGKAAGSQANLSLPNGLVKGSGLTVQRDAADRNNTTRFREINRQTIEDLRLDLSGLPIKLDSIQEPTLSPGLIGVSH